MNGNDDPPGWHFWRSPAGVWFGTRDEPLTDAEWKDAEISRTLHAGGEGAVKERAERQNKLRRNMRR